MPRGNATAAAVCVSDWISPEDGGRLGEESMFGEFGKDADIRIMLLLTLYILLVPIMAMNLLVAM